MFINIESLKNRAVILRDFCLDLIFPIECLGCGQEGNWLCKACFSKIKLNETELCFNCKKNNSFGRACPDCQSESCLDGVLSAVDYEQPLVRKLIKTLKYNFIKAVSEILARLLILFLIDLLFKSKGKVLPQILIKTGDVLFIPVPLHSRRKRWRGFNQAEEIGRPVAKYFNAVIHTDVLIRKENNQPQVKLKEQARLENIKDCFAINSKAVAVKNKLVFLIDDVVTTGATLNECAKVLKQAGAREVWGLAVAKS